MTPRGRIYITHQVKPVPVRASSSGVTGGAHGSDAAEATTSDYVQVTVEEEDEDRLAWDEFGRQIDAALENTRRSRAEEKEESESWDMGDFMQTPPREEAVQYEAEESEHPEADPEVEEEEDVHYGRPQTEDEPEDEMSAGDEDGNEDWWEPTEHAVIRHHVKPRTKKFHPGGNKMELVVGLARLQPTRTTVKHYENGDVDMERDNWKDQRPDRMTRYFTEVGRFQKGPLGVQLVRRATINTDTGETIADETVTELHRGNNLTRKLPEGVSNITVAEPDEAKPWTGTATFKLIPLSEETKEKFYDMDPQEDTRRAMTRGQRKNFVREVEELEEKDLAMWAVLTRRPAHEMEDRDGDLLWMRPVDSPLSGAGI